MALVQVTYCQSLAFHRKVVGMPVLAFLTASQSTVRSQVDTRSLGTIDERHHKTTKSYYLKKKKKKRASEHEEACKAKPFERSFMRRQCSCLHTKDEAGHMSIWENPSQLTVSPHCQKPNMYVLSARCRLYELLIKLIGSFRHVLHFEK